MTAPARLSAAQPATATGRPVDRSTVAEDALNASLGQIMTGLGASLDVLTVVIGDELDLFRDLADPGRYDATTDSTGCCPSL